ncbi:MHS family MFS transporter (plasmid) [Cupriavidus pauculus]|uniref:MHS family MFS transporter n=1 Tax=Cupriavidus pauculus TaxID=82633 RepID=A0A5P2HA55_9BURK|nr:MFS transporter [Cupriavidus pauculus]QET03990.1 MHS family MFS transporter [Cupriavidus pauculus]
MSSELTAEVRPRGTARREEVKVVVGACVGTVLEWYDFFLYGSLAIFFSSHFFPAGNSTASYLASLATFGIGFIIRPLGAVLFGRFGDKAGRKATFLATVVLMGVSTAGIGLLPSYETLGWASPAILIVLRLLQGLALGGEYGGAAAYIAEHTPSGRRGYATGWLQTTATFGFLLSLAVTQICRIWISTEDFASWGWRVPFLASLLLLAVSTYIRTTLSESPVFRRMKAENRTSSAPLRDSLMVGQNVRRMLAVLFGAQAAVGVVWYTCNFYVLYFLTSTLKVPASDAYGYLVVALIFSLPLYVFFGWLSDKVGRKWIVLIGCGMAVVTFLPIFSQLSKAVNPGLAHFQQSVTIRIASSECNDSMFSDAHTACDKARDFLTQAGLSYRVEPGLAGEPLVTYIGDKPLYGFDASTFKEALVAAGYPPAADTDAINRPVMYGLLFLLMIWGAMAYGPMSAYYVELFPAAIRYTSISIPYNIGAGYFGGLAPFMSTALAVKSGDVLGGLWYAIIVGGVSVALGIFVLKETKDVDVNQ